MCCDGVGCQAFFKLCNIADCWVFSLTELSSTRSLLQLKKTCWQLSASWLLFLSFLLTILIAVDFLTVCSCKHHHNWYHQSIASIMWVSLLAIVLTIRSSKHCFDRSIDAIMRTSPPFNGLHVHVHCHHQTTFPQSSSQIVQSLSRSIVHAILSAIDCCKY